MKFPVVASLLIVLTLAGCMTPIMVRNPVNGDIAQCLATGAFPIMNQHQCVAAYENMGWERTTAPEARQAQQQQSVQRDAKIKAAMEECHNARLSGSLKTFLASAQCSNPRIRDAYQQSGYPFMDLIDLRNAARAADAEKIDKGQMTEAEATLHFAQVSSQIADEAIRRIQEAKASDDRMQANNIAADAVRAQVLLGIQKQNNDNFNAQQQRQVDIFRAGLPQPQLAHQPWSATCNRMGDFTSCSGD
jgi:hypothetical protein